MYEFFKDSPALQWMEESGRADERRKAQLQLQETRKQAEQQLRAEQKKALAALRQMVTGIVSERFPTLQRLAKKQVRALKQPDRFQQVVIDLSLAHNSEEAQNVLLDLDENGEEEENV